MHPWCWDVRDYRDSSPRGLGGAEKYSLAKECAVVAVFSAYLSILSMLHYSLQPSSLAFEQSWAITLFAHIFLSLSYRKRQTTPLMEALVAVGLAGNVVQFVTCAGSFLKTVQDIRKVGSPSCLPDLKDLTKTLTRHATLLKSRLQASSAIQSLSEENQNLLTLIMECEQTGQDFLTYIDTFTNRQSSSSSSSNFLKTTKVALKFQLVAHRIEQYASEVERLRSSLTLATMLALRTSTESNNVKVLDHLKAIQQDIRCHSGDHNNGSYNQENYKQEVDRVVDLVATGIQEQVSNSFDALQLEIQAGVNNLSTLKKEYSTQVLFKDHEIEILKWLNFRQMTWRHDSVQQAYSETYHWIFEAPDSCRLWDNYTDYLKQENQIKPYFMQGKAGSGKSTLMRFIYDHLRTDLALREWAGAKNLLVLHFFFWNLGTTLQKTHLGMLRALLHDALRAYPELIPVVLPKQYWYWDAKVAETEPEYIEMKRAFALLVEKARPYIKIVIFIDGVDEFSGDERDLSTFLRSLTSPHLKVIVSSRPVTGALSVFNECPGLRLQDLTRSDMEKFVQGELSTHHLMLKLLQRFPSVATQIATDIITKAEGVFLWVVLVVNLLIRGLENGDDVDELQLKLKSLPSDLRELYRGMFGKMKPENRVQAAKIFQLVRQWSDCIFDQQLPALVLAHALSPPAATFSVKVALLTYGDFDWMMSQLDLRIRSRCCGLLEIRDGPSASSTQATAIMIGEPVSLGDVNRCVVTYLHRTVAEFIATDDVWHYVCALTKDEKFDVCSHLASACLSAMKTAWAFADSDLIWYVEVTSLFLRQVAIESSSTASAFLNEMDKTVTIFHRAKHGIGGELKPQIFGSKDDMGVGHIGMHLYAAKEAITIPCAPDTDETARFCMVQHAIMACEAPVNRPYAPSREDNKRELAYLLKNVLSPETIVCGRTLWQDAIRACNKLSRHPEGYDFSAELLIIFLKATKSPQAMLHNVVNGDQPINLDCVLESLKPGYKSNTTPSHPPRCQQLLWNEIESLVLPRGDSTLTSGETEARTRGNGSSRSASKKSRRKRKLQARNTGHSASAS